MGRKAIQMIGRTFGLVDVLRESPSSTPKCKIFIVRCRECGEQREMLGGNIRRIEIGGTSGCLCKSKARIHGLWDHPIYSTWSGMMARCYSENHVAYENYGGRGIDVTPEWRDSPVNFIAWAEENGWSPEKQLDRRDNDQGYSPQNCRFVTAIVNMNNRSVNRVVVVGGKSLTVSQAARHYGLNKTTIKERLNRGWSDEDAVRPVGGTA